MGLQHGCGECHSQSESGCCYGGCDCAALGHLELSSCQDCLQVGEAKSGKEHEVESRACEVVCHLLWH